MEGIPNSSSPREVSRRGFFKLAATAAGVLTLGGVAASVKPSGVQAIMSVPQGKAEAGVADNLPEGVPEHAVEVKMGTRVVLPWGSDNYEDPNCEYPRIQHAEEFPTGTARLVTDYDPELGNLEESYFGYNLSEQYDHQGMRVFAVANGDAPVMIQLGRANSKLTVEFWSDANVSAVAGPSIEGEMPPVGRGSNNVSVLIYTDGKYDSNMSLLMNAHDYNSGVVPLPR